MGYDIVPQLISDDLAISLKQKILEYSKQEYSYGIRDIHYKISEINNLENSELILEILK